VLGFQDECWWSRVTEPNLSAWSEQDRPLRLLEKAGKVPKGEPKALSCYGLLRGDTGGMLLRFAEGRPVSALTEQFLAWLCKELAAEGKQALLLIWDNAAWHTSQRVRAWIREHNRAVKQHGGVRIVACYLPIKSPWLNNIEPKWIHGKRAVAEPDEVLAAAELVRRVFAYYGSPETPPLSTVVP
jgi:hypothetical protein